NEFCHGTFTVERDPDVGQLNGDGLLAEDAHAPFLFPGTARLLVRQLEGCVVTGKVGRHVAIRPGLRPSLQGLLDFLHVVGGRLRRGGRARRGGGGGSRCSRGSSGYSGGWRRGRRDRGRGGSRHGGCHERGGGCRRHGRRGRGRQARR